MRIFWKVVLPILVIVGLALAFLTHKGVINAEIPVDYNPDPYPLQNRETCDTKALPSAKPKSSVGQI